MAAAQLPALLTSRSLRETATEDCLKTPVALAVPGTLLEVSAAFIEVALRADGILPVSVSVLSVTVEPTAISGLLSTTGRAYVTYSESELYQSLPPTLIVKMQCENETNRNVAVEADNYAMEALAYEHFTKDMTIGTPACHYVARDVANGNHVFVMEDLTLRSGLYAVGQFDGNGCSQKEALSVAQALGNLHAQYWRWSEPLPSCLRATHEIEARDVATLVTECANAFRASAYYANMSEPARSAYDSVLDRAESLGAALQKSPATLLHHDCRADNLFWGDRSALGGLIVLDWQMIGQGVGPLDLAWFTGGSYIGSEDQDPFAKHVCIVKAYWHHLCEAGVDASRYPLEAAWRDYLLGLVWSALVVVQVTKYGAYNPTLFKFVQRHVTSMMEVSAHMVPFERLV